MLPKLDIKSIAKHNKCLIMAFVFFPLSPNELFLMQRKKRGTGDAHCEVEVVGKNLEARMDIAAPRVYT